MIYPPETPNIGPRACPRSDIAPGQINRVITNWARADKSGTYEKLSSVGLPYMDAKQTVGHFILLLTCSF